MLKSLRSSFGNNKSSQSSTSTSTLTSAPTPRSNLPPPTSKVSITKQLRNARSLYQEGIQSYDSQKFQHSFTCLQEAVQIQELSLGKYHEDTIRSYWRLGRAACQCTELPPSSAVANTKHKRKVVLQAFQRAARMADGPFGDAEYEAMIQDMKDSYQKAFLLSSSSSAAAADATTATAGGETTSTTISTSGSVSGGEGSDDNQSVNSNLSGSHWSCEDSNKQHANNNSSANNSTTRNLHQDPMKHLQKVFELEQRGDAFVKKKNYRKASSTYSQALQLQDKVVGEDSLDGADIRCKLALCFMNTGSTPQARRALQMAYTCFVAQVGTDHPATLGAVARMKKIAMTSSSTRSMTSVGSSTNGGGGGVI